MRLPSVTDCRSASTRARPIVMRRRRSAGRHIIANYNAYAQAFRFQIASMVCEGVFTKYPKLKVVILESGVTWAPAFLGVCRSCGGVCARGAVGRSPPVEIVRDHVRFTVAPFDVPPDARTIARVIDHLGSEEFLLYASDFPHWQHDDDDAMPPHVPGTLQDKIRIDHPLATYPRLKEDAA